MGVKVYQVGKGKPKQTKFEIENNSFISDVKIGNDWLPFIDSGIKRYEYNSKAKYIKYGQWLAEPRDIKFFKNPKVLIREVVNPRIFSCYVESEYIVKNTAAVVIQKLPQYDLMFLLGLLNSKFFNYYVLTQSPKSNNKTFPSITSALIKQFRIPSDCESSCEKISNIVSEILTSKELKKDTLLSQLDAKIDYIVYKMYDLTYDEVTLIDSEFKLSENEYQNLRLN
jgi:adenine-specific DNA-methyltransferase